MIRLFLFLAGALVAAEAAALDATELLGSPLTSLSGEPVGTVEDLIVDTSAGRVVYLIVDRGARFATYPIGALRRQRTIDRRREGEVARFDSPEDTRFRRAARLIGQPLAHPGATQRIGTIRDFEFDTDSGQITRVVVATDEGESGFAPGVLRHGRFPPLTYWGGDYVDTQDLENLGWLRRPPSDERRRFHDHRW